MENSKIVDINFTLVNTFNSNGNAPIKRQRISNWILKITC